jgi:hypothetical protein
MKLRVDKKIELFNASFAIALEDTGPSYNTHPGIITCDPQPTPPPNVKRNHISGETYEKLTNFIKVSRLNFNYVCWLKNRKAD